MPQSFINKVLAGVDIIGEVHICGKKLQNTKILNFTRLSNCMVYKSDICVVTHSG
jgi:hypothetical protein